MTLATHAVVGAAFAQLFPEYPIAAFAVGFASHLAIDSLPHWDYKILSLEKVEGQPLETNMAIGKYFLKDCLRIGSDAMAGILLSIVIFGYFFRGTPLSIILIGAVAGILPDPLQFVYWKTRSPLLLPLQTFHVWVQKGRSIHVHPFVGLFLQFIVVVAISTAILLVR
jgi:hypothetical protein